MAKSTKKTKSKDVARIGGVIYDDPIASAEAVQKSLMGVESAITSWILDVEDQIREAHDMILEMQDRIEMQAEIIDSLSQRKRRWL